MGNRKYRGKALDNWDGLQAAIFMTAAEDDREYIRVRIKCELRKRGYHHNTIKKHIAIVADDIRQEVASYVIREFENYPHNKRKDAFNNRNRVKGKILKSILENIKDS